MVQKMQRGFNLFTALVAIVLIVLAVLLSQQMVRVERERIETLKTIQEEQKMLAIADLAKADALQVFNFGIRFSIEEWLTYDKDPADGIPDNTYLLSQDMALNDNAWELIKDDFAGSQFGVSESGDSPGTQLAFLASQHLTSLLLSTPDVAGYSIDLAAPNEAELRVLLQKVFTESSKQRDFFKVIGCDGTLVGCEKGTFYVNLNLRRPDEGGYLTDAEYEKFPQIGVTNNQTGRVLKQPILPRGNLQIYVPVRLFKALAKGLAVAKHNGKGVFEKENEFWQRIDEARTGICDAGSCSARTNYLLPALEELLRACYGDRSVSTGGTVNFQSDGFSANYDPADQVQQRTTLALSVQQNLVVPYIQSLADEERISENDFELAEVGALAVTIPTISRQILSTGSNGEKVGDGFCTEVSEVSSTLVFEEKNKEYIVAQDASAPRKFGVKLFDNRFSVFEGPIGTCTTKIDDLQDYTCEFS